MIFRNFLDRQRTLHPSMRPQDIVKQCYQAAYGAEHLMDDLPAAEARFEQEFAEAPAEREPLFERISPEVCRVNLSAWRESGLPAGWLFQMFLLSAQTERNGSKQFSAFLSDADDMVRSGAAGFPYSEWVDYLAEYQKNGMGAVHHSAAYRMQETPSYRIVSRRILRLLPILQKLSFTDSANKPLVLALDGRSAAGKTTAGEQLGRILGGSVVHMDDFFLPGELRTEERLAEPGGNVHYERFADEVLPRLKSGKDFAYRIFDCGEMGYSGCRRIEARPFCIVEGSYSCHPAFGAYADVKAFFDIDRRGQMARLLRRNGAEAAERFRTCWIPLEERYFADFRIRETADLILAEAGANSLDAE